MTAYRKVFSLGLAHMSWVGPLFLSPSRNCKAQPRFKTLHNIANHFDKLVNTISVNGA